MHDPDVVAWDLVLPVPLLKRWPTQRRWELRRRRRTNPENLGECVYPWYRPVGYEVAAFGRRVRLYQWGTIWHQEPGGRDSGEVCRHWRTLPDGTHKVDRSWRWHVHHWHLQFIPGQQLKRALITRCAGCGGRSTRRNPVNCTNSWYPPKVRWWRSETWVYHSQCLASASTPRQKDATT